MNPSNTPKRHAVQPAEPVAPRKPLTAIDPFGVAAANAARRVIDFGVRRPATVTFDSAI
ncbi:hypothetical protein [Streptomyces sp. NPDC008092]|uniref:hypothetical protein n=1 Tax=Streptomyces sp. NPDC008092 TaxID=3364808 RepID=UPI0036EE1F18